MSTKLKLLPAFVMLLAGAFTSIITFVIGYTLKSALIILLFVLVIFYILGLVLQKLIVKFEEANKPKDEENPLKYFANGGYKNYRLIIGNDDTDILDFGNLLFDIINLISFSINSSYFIFCIN